MLGKLLKLDAYRMGKEEHIESVAEKQEDVLHLYFDTPAQDLSSFQLSHFIEWLLFSQSMFLQPFQHIVFRCGHIVTRDGRSLYNGCILLKFSNGLDRLREAAATMRAKWDDSLAAKIIFFKERI